MTIKTVGDLKKALQIFDDSLLIDVEGYEEGTERSNLGFTITGVDAYMKGELGVRGVSIYAQLKDPAARRYILAYDDSGHKYAIPAEKSREWESWLHSAAWEAGDVPDYAIRIDGHFSFLGPK